MATEGSFYRCGDATVPSSLARMWPQYNNLGRVSERRDKSATKVSLWQFILSEYLLSLMYACSSDVVNKG